MKNTFKSTLLASCALSVSVKAAMININNLTAQSGEPDAGGNTRVVSGFDVSGSLVGSTYTFTLTQTGNLDGGLGADDTLTFDLIYEAYTGSDFIDGDVTLGTQSTPNTSNVNWHNNTFESGDTISLEVANINYTSAESRVAFDGFTSFRVVSFAAAPDGAFDFYVGTTGATVLNADPTFNADLESNGTSSSLFFTAGGGPFRLRDLDLQFETSPIPEPSSTALLGLGGLALILRRRM